MAYTLDDMAEAERQVQACSERIDNHRANNPDYGRADLRAAQRHLRIIVDDLKARGILPKSAKEILEGELSARFPKAKSREVVEHKGKRYMRRFAPAQLSRSRKTVMEWERWWEEVE